VKAFAYRRAETLEEAAGGTGRPLGGGTDLLPLMKERLLSPESVVDLTRVAEAGASAIAALPDGGLRLGGLVTLAELARDARVVSGYAALAEAAASSATPQIRNTATLAGNLCQWNRCWYFRSGIPCHLSGASDCPAVRGDNRYHALFGDGPCVAVHPSDPAVALAAFGAVVEVVGRSGTRDVPLAEFLHPARPGSPEQAALARGELVAGVRLPGARERTSAYAKAMDRKAWAFALVSAAVVVGLRNGTVEEADVVLGGVAGVPWRADAVVRRLRGRPLSAETVRQAAAAAAEGARPLAHNGYKLDLACAVVRSALARLAGG
jgi:xanthine dehydrogenase YagS FAD-binding subunit